MTDLGRIPAPKGASIPTEPSAPACSGSATAKAPAFANNGAGDAVHAFVENGELYIMDGGAYWRFDRDRAWAEWFWCASSPIASTQERARQLRAAMDEAYPDQRIAA